MYSIKVEPSDKRSPVIKRRMSSNSVRELVPVLIQIAKDRYEFINPVAIWMGEGRYKIIDLSNPNLHATVDINLL